MILPWGYAGRVGVDKLMPAFRLLGIGFYIAACIVGGVMIGWWLGGKNLLFILIGLVAGLIVAFYGVYRMVRPLMNNKNNKPTRENSK